MTIPEAELLIEQLKLVFDIVRLVDVERTEVCSFDKNGQLRREPLYCFSVWDKDARCENCVSSKLCAEKQRVEKFEFVNHEVYHVTSKYVEIEGQPYALEIVSKTTDDTLFEAYGKDRFIEAIETMNRRMYADELTGVCNRRYLREQINWKRKLALAVVDIDDFKQINDTYGHRAGDVALQEIAAILKDCKRKDADAVIRYGGDEFLVIYGDIPEDLFTQRMERVRQAVRSLKLKDYPGLALSVSIGGAYRRTKEDDLFGIADKRLYQAKRQKDAVCLE